MEKNKKEQVPATPLTYGQKAVGLTFNPGGNPDVDKCKQSFADLIDKQNELRNRTDASPETKRLASITITQMQEAQMWAVKAITWKD